MQCFRVGYRGICHAPLVFSIQVACSTVSPRGSYEKALHNYFISCLYLWKIYGNFLKSAKISGISENFGNASKPSLKIFGKSSESLKIFWKLFENQNVFYIFGKSSELKYSDVFGKFRKCSVIFGKLRKRFKTIFQEFL